MMIGVTKWKYTQAAIDEREETCEVFPEYCRNEGWFIEELSLQFAEKFDQFKK